MISDDGRYVAFMSYASNLVATDTGGKRNIFVRDRQADHTALVSVGMQGQPANGESFGPDLSPDGRYLFFTSERNFTSIPMRKKLGYAAMQALIHRLGNGLGDIYQIDLSIIGVTGLTRSK